jgi:hypothetical protein
MKVRFLDAGAAEKSVVRVTLNCSGQQSDLAPGSNNGIDSTGRR